LFAETVRLIVGIQHLLYISKKKKTTPTMAFVSSVKEEVLATLEGLEEVVEDREEPLVFQLWEQYALMILG